MVCRNCGRELDEGTAFCPNCGCKVVAEQTPYANAQNQAPIAVPGKGFAIASLVLGIVSFFCAGIVCGILAIVFGYLAMKKGFVGGMAKAGFVCGIVGASLAVFMILATFLMGGIGMASMFSYFL